jgi:hypothetical protein
MLFPNTIAKTLFFQEKMRNRSKMWREKRYKIILADTAISLRACTILTLELSLELSLGGK